MLLKKVWNCGPYARAMIICLVASPVSVLGALVVVALLVLEKISPTSYVGLGQPFIYFGLVLMIAAMLSFVVALQRGELNNLKGTR
jgi:hypothetical protein